MPNPNISVSNQLEVAREGAIQSLLQSAVAFKEKAVRFLSTRKATAAREAAKHRGLDRWHGSWCFRAAPGLRRRRPTGKADGDFFLDKYGLGHYRQYVFLLV